MSAMKIVLFDEGSRNARRLLEVEGVAIKHISCCPYWDEMIKRVVTEFAPNMIIITDSVETSVDSAPLGWPRVLAQIREVRWSWGVWRYVAKGRFAKTPAIGIFLHQNKMSWSHAAEKGIDVLNWNDPILDDPVQLREWLESHLAKSD